MASNNDPISNENELKQELKEKTASPVQIEYELDIKVPVSPTSQEMQQEAMDDSMLLETSPRDEIVVEPK